MPQTRMFRDRVVSMEQTFEGGEKHLDLLKSLCREAFPEFEYVGHQLDHERDLFVMELAAPDGRKKSVGWTRMVLFDTERIPVLSGDPAALLRGQIVEYLRARASRSEILVTFRHLEDGWVDTPEPRRERRRRRRGRGEARGAQAAARPRPGTPPPREATRTGPRPPSAGGARPPASETSRPARAARPPRETPAARGEAPRPAAAEAERGEGGRGGRRRFRRRRRRGRGSSGGGPSAPSAPA